jgi:PAS domain S-box-containing protein
MNEENSKQELINRIKFLEQQNVKLEKRLQVLEKSEKFHRTTLENISDTAVITTDLDGSIIYVCPNTHYTLGFSQNEVYELVNINNLIDSTIFEITELQAKIDIENIQSTVADKSGKEHYLLLNIKWLSHSNSILYVIRDITDFRLSQKELQEYDKKYYTIYDQVPVGIATIDSFNGHFLEINCAYCDILGFNKSEMMGMDFMQITYLEDLNEDLDNMERLRSGEINSFRMQKRYIRKDGKIVWVYLTVVPLWNEYTDPHLHIAIVNDITEQKLFETALIENEKKYKNLVNNLPGTAYQFILTAKGDYKFEYMGDNCHNLFGYSKKEILANSNLIFGLIPQPDADMVTQSIKNSADTLTRFDIEHRIIKKTGQLLWIQESSIPQKLSNGDILWDGIGYH